MRPKKDIKGLDSHLTSDLKGINGEDGEGPQGFWQNGAWGLVVPFQRGKELVGRLHVPCQDCFNVCCGAGQCFSNAGGHKLHQARLKSSIISEKFRVTFNPLNDSRDNPKGNSTRKDVKPREREKGE